MKKLLRKQVLAARDGLTPEERSEKSRQIEERLFSLPEFRDAKMVLFFASFRSEVDTIPMIRRALAGGKRVILPKVKGRVLELYEIAACDTDVVPGAWGIPEPCEKQSASIGDVDLIVVPGAGFDQRGNRVGYGAGYYDRLLPAFPRPTVALAFEAQILASVPADAHDVPVKKIVTEKRVITAQGA